MTIKTPRPPAEPKELLNVHQVAERLGISVRTVWRMVSRGTLSQPIRFSRKLIRFSAKDLTLALDRLGKEVSA